MTYEEVSDALTNLAEKENSLIAKTITETDDSGRTTTSYDVFGKGELPQGLVKADRLVASQANLYSVKIKNSGSPVSIYN